MRFNRPKFMIAVAVIALVAPVQIAVAADKTGNAIADTLLEILEASGANTIAYSSVEGTQRSARITDLKADVVREGTNFELTIASVQVDDAAFRTDGRLSAEKLTLTGMSATFDMDGLTIGHAEFSNTVFPTPEEARAGASGTTADAPRSGGFLRNIVFRPDTGGELPIESVNIQTGEVVKGLLTGADIQVRNVIVTKEILQDPESAAQLQALGYDKLVVGMDISFTYDAATGIINLNKMAISAADAGTLSITAKIGNLTPGLIDKINQSDDPMQTVGDLQNLSINALSLRIDNNSIIDRSLEMQAKLMGVSRAQFVEQMIAAMPMMLGMLQNPEFQGNVAAAVGAFLKDPRSLTATAQPPQPVPVAQIVGTAMMAPQSIPTILNVTIQANQ